MKGIKREFSVSRTPQQNGIAKRKNRTLIEVARTMLVDSLLPISLWAEAVNIACYVQNRVLVTKPQNKTPYELLLGRTPSIGLMRHFGCLVTILNTLDPLEKVGEENVQQYVLFPLWSFGFKNPHNTDDDAAFEVKEPEFEGRKPKFEVHVSPSSYAKHDDKTKIEAKGKSPVELSIGYRNFSAEFKDFSNSSINEVNATDSPVPTVGQISTNSTNTFSAVGPFNTAVSPTHGKLSYVDTSQYLDDLNMLEWEDITYTDDEEDVGAEADFANLETTIIISPIPTTRVHKDHHVTQIIGDLSSATQTRSMTRVVKDQSGLTQINNEDFRTCMFACFLSQEEPKRVHQALKDLSWIEVMQEELLQFKMQKVWVLVDLPNGKKAIGHTQEEGINYEEVFAPVARIEAIRSMIGSLMYLTSSRPDIMFSVCACARFQVTPKVSHLHAVKRIFRYLKGKPHLGLWYPKDSPFNLVAYSDSDYAIASLDRKSTIEGCQFLGCRLISWQCKKQTVVATLSTEAEYVAAASCCA
nr:uncharacterized mitochondrial protein AtMg00810-like [Tanacetum cinerariifolium]